MSRVFQKPRMSYALSLRNPAPAERCLHGIVDGAELLDFAIHLPFAFALASSWVKD